MKKAYLEIKEEFLKEKKSKKSFKEKIPNILTLSRGFAPLVVVPLILTGNIVPGLVTGCLFASTDFFDGLLARKFNASSTFGQKLDPICDKIFAVSLLGSAAIINPLLMLNIVLEVLISAINIKSLEKDNKPKTTILGKIKTFLLSLNILATLIPGVSKITSDVLIAITLLCQMATAAEYAKIDKQKDITKNSKNSINISNEDKKEKVKTEEKEMTNSKSKTPSKKTIRRKQKIELLKYKKSLLVPEKEKVYTKHHEKNRS